MPTPNVTEPKTFGNPPGLGIGLVRVYLGPDSFRDGLATHGHKLLEKPKPGLRHEMLLWLAGVGFGLTDDRRGFLLKLAEPVGVFGQNGPHQGVNLGLVGQDSGGGLKDRTAVEKLRDICSGW